MCIKFASTNFIGHILILCSDLKITATILRVICHKKAQHNENLKHINGNRGHLQFLILNTELIMLAVIKRQENYFMKFLFISVNARVASYL